MIDNYAGKLRFTGNSKYFLSCYVKIQLLIFLIFLEYFQGTFLFNKNMHFIYIMFYHFNRHYVGGILLKYDPKGF